MQNDNPSVPRVVASLAFCWMLAVSNSAAAAERVLASKSPAKGGVDVYIDRDIRKSADTIKAWELRDYKVTKVTNGQSWASVKVQTEYDCKKEMMRDVMFVFHSANMAKGNVVHSFVPSSGWQPVPSGTVSHGVWKLGCAKRQP